MPATISFAKIRRDCPYNHEVARGTQSGRYIYDFDVLIDGEKRARFVRKSASGGYFFVNANGTRICTPGDRYGMAAASQEEFARLVQFALEKEYVPTLAQLAAEREDTEHNRIAEEAARAKSRRDSVIRQCGVELFETAKRVCNMLDQGALGAGHQQLAEAVAKVEALLLESVS